MVRPARLLGLISMPLLWVPLAQAQPLPERVLACGGQLHGNTIQITEQEASCPWPFDVERMEIKCNSFGPETGEVYFTSEKGSYALNGKAKASFDDPRPIWRNNPDGELFGKIDVSPWIKAGLGLC